MKIAIIGGGIGGLVTAFLAAEAGHEVTVFEKDKVGSGASGKALGVLVPVTGLDRPIDRLQREGIARWPALTEKLTTAARRRPEWSDLMASDFWQDRQEGRQQMRLPLLFDVIKTAIEGLGGVVEENRMVASPTLLRSEYDRVVLAAGLGNVELAGTSMKVSAGVAGRFKGAVRGLVAADNLFICPDWDGTVIAGSVNWDMPEAGNGVVPDSKLEELVRRVQAQVPGLELVEAWVGYRPVEVPRLPLVRDLGGGVLAVVGLGKVGIGVSPMIWPELEALL